MYMYMFGVLFFLTMSAKENSIVCIVCTVFFSYFLLGVQQPCKIYSLFEDEEFSVYDRMQ